MGNQINRRTTFAFTIVIAPVTTKSQGCPSPVTLRFKGKDAWIVLDRILTVDRVRLVNELGTLVGRIVRNVKDFIRGMLVE